MCCNCANWRRRGEGGASCVNGEALGCWPSSCCGRRAGLKRVCAGKEGVAGELWTREEGRRRPSGEMADYED